MTAIHPINQTLLVLLDNQVARTAAAFEGLTEGDLDAHAGGDCHTIRQIATHLLGLRKFQLSLLNSPLAAEAPAAPAELPALLAALARAAELVRRELTEHDANDWLADPTGDRPGPWADEPTLTRVIRPLNDFTNHLGAIRALRRIRANPAPRTQ